MTFTEGVHLLDLNVSREVAIAARYLERIGQKFCVDFGYENAIEKARAHWNERRRALRRKRR